MKHTFSNHKMLGPPRWRAPGANWKMGAVRHFTSNPYCLLRLGGTSFRSSTVKNSTNPDWPLSDAAYFIVHNREQELQVDVMDNDEGFLQRNFVGLLGRLRLTVSQLLSGAETVKRYKLDTSEVKSGLLHVDDPVNTGIPSESWDSLKVLRCLESFHRSG